MAEVLACGTWKCGATCTDCWKAPYTTSSFKERLEDSERPQHRAVDRTRVPNYNRGRVQITTGNSWRHWKRDGYQRSQNLEENGWSVNARFYLFKKSYMPRFSFSPPKKAQTPQVKNPWVKATNYIQPGTKNLFH